MLDTGYLALQLHRLKGGDEWAHGASDELCFVFPKGGLGSHAVPNHAQPLAPGDLLLLRNGKNCKLTTGKGGDFVFWFFCLRAEHLLPLFNASEIALFEDVLEDLGPSKHFVAATPVAAESHRLLAEVPPGTSLDHRAQLVRVAAGILGNEFKRSHDRTGFISPGEHIVQVFEKLSADDLLNLSIEELAARFGVSRRHLNRLFHHYLGFSAAALKTEIRLLRAVALLRDPTAKVMRVAEKCGFNHLGLFNTSFRRRFGVSPGQWRKSGATVDTATASALRPSKSCLMPLQGLCPWGKTLACAPAPVRDRKKRRQ